MDLLSSGLSLATGQQLSGSEGEKQLRPMLTDDNIQVLSSLELNSIASLTFNDRTCDEIYEYIQSICSQPLSYSPLTLQKALVVTKHTLIYGAEKTVNHAYGVQDHVRALLNFNTVLMKQQQGGISGIFQSIQGGGVDKGGPVREAAADVLKLLSNINELRRIRNASASQESLVPVGSNEQIGFVTDEVRHHVLKKRLEAERHVQIKSNLAKADNGWGAGYNSQDGRAVVGAAHGIDEMIKMAKIADRKTKSKFSDDKDAVSIPDHQTTEEERILAELKAEADAAKASSVPASDTGDLLGSFDPSPVSPQPSSGVAQADLLGFGGATNAAPTSGTGDLLGSMPLSNPQAPIPSAATMSSNHDPFGFAAVSSNMNAGGMMASTTNYMGAPGGGGGGLPTMHSISQSTGVGVDQFAPQPSSMQQQQQQQSMMNGMNGITGAMNTMSVTNNPSVMSNGPMHQQPVMGSTNDRFSALDALATAGPVSSPAVPVANDISAQAAENKILGLLSQPSSTSANTMGMPPPNGFTMSQPSTTTAATAMPTMTMMGGMGQPAMTFTMPSMMNPPPPPPVPPPPPPVVPLDMVQPGSGQVAKAYGDPSDSATDEDNPWVMGGSVGTGLQPIGPAPGAPPPPPPPPAY